MFIPRVNACCVAAHPAKHWGGCVLRGSASHKTFERARAARRRDRFKTVALLRAAWQRILQSGANSSCPWTGCVLRGDAPRDIMRWMRAAWLRIRRAVDWSRAARQRDAFKDGVRTPEAWPWAAMLRKRTGLHAQVVPLVPVTQTQSLVRHNGRVHPGSELHTMIVALYLEVARRS